MMKKGRNPVFGIVHNLRLVTTTHNQQVMQRDFLRFSDGTGHGTGTRPIMAFCEKHNAFYDFSTEGDWFKLVITL